MILLALKEYADRKGDALGSLGYEIREIPFVIVLNSEGEFVDFQDMRQKEGKKLKAKPVEVPQSQGRSGKDSWKTAFVLWDHYGYVCGHSAPAEEKDSMARKQHEAFIGRVRGINQRCPDDVGVHSVLCFLEKGDFSKVFAHSAWPECAKIKGCNLTFKVAGELKLVCQSDSVRKYVAETTVEGEGEDLLETICLVTGAKGNLMRLHPTIALPGLTKPSPLCAINDGESPAFSSFGKSQGHNFPVSKPVALEYAKALNSLIKSPSQRLTINKMTLVFWSAEDSTLEKEFLDFFVEPPKDNPSKQVDAVRALFKAVESGAYHESQDQTRFYVLGLSPNTARIAIRFWIVDTVSGMAGKIRQHFEDLWVIHGPKEKDTFSLFRLLVSTAVQGKAENIPPNLAGETMRAIIEGLPYPQTLLHAAVRRIRAEHGITYPRAAIIKACINRSTRFKTPNTKEELKMSLDESNTDIGYRLGRLFAALEKIQQEANPGINATIRDRFYGAASGTPVTVFGNLMRLKNHHLAKLERPGRRVFFEKLLGQIIDGVDAKIAFPAHLDMADQGRFAIGYYHQMQDFYVKKSDRSE